ncbi:MAG: hypothetical protein GY913_10615 [Proteobacteria bacterium]|nr:hypothetical protein [Pseudomonadota bacterium]MCP4917365.1 hypothetical protein [Pseudomonadota bacterium]
MEDPDPMMDRHPLRGLHRLDERAAGLVTAEYLRRVGDARWEADVTLEDRRRLLAEVVEDFVTMRALVGPGVEVEGLTPNWTDQGLTLRKL